MSRPPSLTLKGLVTLAFTTVKVLLQAGKLLPAQLLHRTVFGFLPFLRQVPLPATLALHPARLRKSCGIHEDGRLLLLSHLIINAATWATHSYPLPILEDRSPLGLNHSVDRAVFLLELEGRVCVFVISSF